MQRTRASELTTSFAAQRVLILGDLILDRYVWGNTDRVSPEAPVPVVQVSHESTMLGGAGNVARNIANLGGMVELVAVVGQDEAARELSRLFSDWKIDAGGLVVESGRPTTQKTRIIARAQQVVRYDRESEDPVAEASQERLLPLIRAKAAEVDGVVIQDYGKGLLTRELIQDAMMIFAERSLRVFVDPKEGAWDVYRDAELVKPNLREAEKVTGIRVRDDSDVERVGWAVLDLTGARMVAITRGARGISLFSSEHELQHIPTAPRAVADVAGAGDTAIATLALARLSNASWAEAAELANYAAGFVVGVPGTASLTAAELLDQLRPAG